MVILGAQGLAKELATVLEWNNNNEELSFFDDVNENVPKLLFGKFLVIRSLKSLKNHFIKKSNRFILGVGNPRNKRFLCEKAENLGGELCGLISAHALIGAYENNIGQGVCVLSHATITVHVTIGKAVLVNKAAIISHDVLIGDYCEISPGAKILGNVIIGEETLVGANAVILPHVCVGCRCRIGAGAVVTKNVPDDITVVGVPAKPLFQ